MSDLPWPEWGDGLTAFLAADRESVIKWLAQGLIHMWYSHIFGIKGSDWTR